MAMSSLAEIEPKSSQRLMDLVDAAGIDVSDWANFKGGKIYAARNPKYCYEWAFPEHPKKLIVLNLWHELMETRRDGAVFIEVNNRWFATQRSGIESYRALKTDEIIQEAVKQKLPVRVIVLGGRRRDNPTEKASHVSKRLLDPVAWSFTSYNWDTGKCVITRGDDKFIDQFGVRQTEPTPPEKHAVKGFAYDRSSIVRTNVLIRANGKCEWCDETGFKMEDGKIFLETHHIIPLSEGGSDVESNVAGLCPNHHREAHHGINRDKMRKDLLKKLAVLYEK
jgi:hypothetical protein